jgi:hypothetical protein
VPDNSVGVEYINICLRAYQRKQERSLLRLCFLELEQEYSKEQSVEQSSGPCGHLSILQKLPSVEYSQILLLSQCHVTSEEGSCILRFRSKPFMSTEAEEACWMETGKIYPMQATRPVSFASSPITPLVAAQERR